MGVTYIIRRLYECDYTLFNKGLPVLFNLNKNLKMNSLVCFWVCIFCYMN